MYRLTNLLKAIEIYYKENGLLATIKRSLEVLVDLTLKKIIDIFLLFGEDSLFEKYYTKEKNIFLDIKKIKGLKIGIIRLGGLGDAIIATSLVTAVKRKWPNAYVYVFVRSESQRQFLSKYKNIDKVIVISEKVDLDGYLQVKMASELVNNEYLDICLLDRYVIKAFFKKGLYPKLKEKMNNLFQKFNLNFDTFPYFTNNLLIYKRNEYELRSASTDLEIDPSGLSVCLNDHDFQILKNLPKSFVTVHHGSDSEFRSKLKNKNNLQTKNWFADRWAKVVKFLQSKGYEVIQLGVSQDEYIPGTIDMRGKTTITEAGAILKNANLHLDTEGGLVHLAKAVGTRSLVLFGPTAIEFYGYKDNINIRAGNCKNCWWSKPDWAFKCPVGYKKPRCMESITVKMVVDTLEKFLKMHLQKQQRFNYKLLDFSLFDSSLINENIETLKDIYKIAEIPLNGFNKSSYNQKKGTYIHGSKNWEYLYAIKMIKKYAQYKDKLRLLDAGAGRGALQIYLANNSNFDVYSCDYNYNDLSPSNIDYGKIFQKKYHKLINFRVASIFNLPYQNNYFDVVCCISVLEHFKEKRFALKELLRVLKPNGLLILTFDITSSEYLIYLEDEYRVEIFTDISLKKFLLEELCININYDISTKLNKAIKNISSYKVEGIPFGLTVGGLAIKKYKVRDNLNEDD